MHTLNRELEEEGGLTLSENKAVGLDEVLEGSLGQLSDVGLAISSGNSSKGGQKAGGEALVLHCGIEM